MADLGVEGTFSMHSGDDRVLEFTVNQQDDSGPEDISGAALTFVITKQSAAVTSPTPAGTPLVTKTIGSGITIVNAANGRADVVLGTADSAALKGTYYYELQMVLGGVTSTVAYGAVVILNDAVE